MAAALKHALSTVVITTSGSSDQSARLFNMHPTGKLIANERLDTLMDDGGIAACGNAQNCVEVCPKSIPLTESIAEMGRQSSKRFWKTLPNLIS